MVGLLLVLLLAAPANSAKVRPKKPAPPPPATQKPLCEGDYSDAVPAAIASQVLDGAREQFVFAVRNTATYEHVYYGHDGKLRRNYVRSVIHGTAFSYKVREGETLLVTNQHVAERPEVTDDEHQVDGVPTGSKKVREQLKLVRSEDDDYEPGHVPLVRVLSDAPADVAILKAHKLLPIMPFRFGRSSALRPGNLVQVRGFPLGAFSAVNVGKVVNPYTEDTEKGWSHADFVVDALLSAGNSGSPVFAISCRTSEPELVGVFHAGYAEAAALNVVVAVDQLREELEMLRVPRRDAALHAEITAHDRDRVVKLLSADRSHAVTFPFGGRAVMAQLSDSGTLRFAVLDEDFPMVSREALALVDRARSGFGTLDAVVVLVDGAPAEVPATALEPDLREHFEKLYDALWHQALGVIDYRARLLRGRQSADAFAQAQQARARLRKRSAEQKEQLGLAIFDTDRVGTVAKSAAAAPGAPRPPPPTAAAALSSPDDE
jgi:serine protease Do